MVLSTLLRANTRSAAFSNNAPVPTSLETDPSPPGFTSHDIILYGEIKIYPVLRSSVADFVVSVYVSQERGPCATTIIPFFQGRKSVRIRIFVVQCSSFFFFFFIYLFIKITFTICA